VILCFVAKYKGGLYTKRARHDKKERNERKEKKTDRDQPKQTPKSFEIFMVLRRRTGRIHAERMGGVKRVHSGVRACGVVEVARDETAKGVVEGEEDR
jgi:hypothetical protein